MNIVVLAGGLSTERDVSLSTGSMVCRALRELGHRVLLLDVYLGLADAPEDISSLFKGAETATEILRIPETAPDLARVKATRQDGGEIFFGPNVLRILGAADLAFIALHGVCGEDGKLQAALDLLDIPYTGSGSLGSALAMDKDMSKTLFASAGIPTAGWVCANASSDPAAIAEKLGLPCVVKPRSGGSSIGVSIPRTREALAESLSQALAYDESVLVEQYIEGREFSVGILEGKALPVIEIIPHKGFYDFKNKYQQGLTDEICPAELDAVQTEDLQRLALRAHQVLRLGSYSRVDFMRGQDGNFICLEANTLPGMTPTSLLPQEANAVGIDYAHLCDRLVNASLHCKG